MVGSVWLIFMGKVCNIYCMIDVCVVCGGLIDFFYYIDFEDVDLENMVVYLNGMLVDCGGNGLVNGKYWY